MPLSTYRAKRHFGITTEPSPSARAEPSEKLRFMVHKHDATRLHYDLRLESEGVLGSWACPKGPSYDPTQKRLAVETEDHPLAYGDFEGRIPDGEYGAGDSIIWDRGTFDTVPPGEFKKQKEKGHLHLGLQGEKLQGGWHLVRTRPQGDKPQWLFFKAKDGTERPDFDVIAERPESVKSGRRITRGPLRKSAAAKQIDPVALLERVWPPTLATLSEPKTAPAEGFVFEVKYDGYRALAAISGGRTAVRSRNQLDFSSRFPFLERAFASIVVGSAVLDGEIIAINAQDRSDFQTIGDPSATHRFVAFDLLWLDGEDLRARPLEERRELLESVLANARPPLVIAERVPGPTSEAMKEAERHGWEGLIAKRRGSRYSGTRSTDWLKLKRVDTAELAIVGWTPHSTGREAVGALLLAAYEAGRYVFAGKVGTGFDTKMRARLLQLLEPDEVAKPEVEGAPRMRKAHWVKPRHVAQLRFSEWTRDRKLRHPSFLGLREDKQPESPLPREGEGQGEGEKLQPNFFGTASTGAGFGVWHSKREHVPLTSGDRVLFPRTGFTKADVRAYYELVTEVMLPALDGRPLSMQQWPQGIARPGFFRHDAASTPEWISTANVQHADKSIRQIVVDRPETLHWLANQSALTLHIPSSRVTSLEEPDWVAFDFDPPGGDWTQVFPLAKALQGLLEELKLLGVPKTSGKRGLHVLVPIARGHTHERAHAFAQQVTAALAQRFPERATTLRAIKARGGRLYLDAEQNGRLKTMVAPYSVRAVEAASVSTPLHWDELSASFDPSQFTIKNFEKRLARVGDLFAPALGRTGRLPKLDSRE